MITIRKSAERGHFDHGWLDTYHTFSFDQYYDPNHMGFRSLRVINEDRVKPGTEFPMHPHRDMEIVTYIIDGELSHRDSMGNGSTIRPGEIQKMSAGRGILHSERNSSAEKTTHLLQIWILPDERGLTPNYNQIRFDDSARHNALLEIASPVDGSSATASGSSAANGSMVTLHQDARIYTSLLDAGKSVTKRLDSGRHAWLQLIKGRVTVNGQDLDPGDGAAISDENQLRIESLQDSEFLLFDLA